MSSLAPLHQPATHDVHCAKCSDWLQKFGFVRGLHAHPLLVAANQLRVAVVPGLARVEGATLVRRLRATIVVRRRPGAAFEIILPAPNN